MKKFPYTDAKGQHWPDTTVGSELYYSIDFTAWLATEGDSLTSVEWYLPLGLSSDDEFLVADEAQIIISADKAGSYKVKCTITSEDNGKSQTQIVSMILVVYP